MDVTRELDSVERTVSAAALEGRALRIVRDLPAPPDDVWQTVTTPERIPTWLAPVSGDFVVGGRYQLEGNAGGEILSCTPGRSLSVTWEFGTEITRVDLRLEEVEDGTRLELVHAGAHEAAKWQAYGPGAVGIGWEMALLALAARLRSSDVDLRAWFTGPAAVDFITGSGTAWGEAAASAGADPALAREAAARCVAAYTTPPGDGA